MKASDRVPGTIDSFYLVLAERQRRERLRKRNAAMAARRERWIRIRSWFRLRRSQREGG